MKKGSNKEDRRIRAEQMVFLRRLGYTLEEIGEKYSLTRERVRQIIGNKITPNEVRELRDERLEQYVEKNREQIIARLREGISLQKIAIEFDVPLRAINPVLRSADRITLSMRAAQSQMERRSQLHDSIPDLQEAARILGRTPSIGDYNELYRFGKLPEGALSSQSVIIRFRNWRDACVAAGLTPHDAPSSSKMGAKRYSTERCLKAIVRYYNEYGEWPTYDKYDVAYAKPCSGTIRKRLGTWTQALLEAQLLYEQERENA